MKGFHFFCQWPAVIWIKHWFYRKFSHWVRDDLLPPQKSTCLIAKGMPSQGEKEEGDESAERGDGWGGGTLKGKKRETDGDTGSQWGRQGEHRGDEKKEQGIRRAAIKRGRRERKKDSVVDEAGLTQNRKGKGFFEVQCSNLSLVPVIVQHLPQLISVKTPSPFFSLSFPSSLPPHSHNQQRDIRANQLEYHHHTGPPFFLFFRWNIKKFQHPRPGQCHCLQRNGSEIK